MALNSHSLFLLRWLRNPLSIAAIAPSSPFLAKAMTASLPAGKGWVIELGGGTGSITKALLESGVQPERLLVIERDLQLYLYLQQKFPRVKVLQGDAGDLKAIVNQAGIDGPIQGTVSGLPLLSMPESTQLAILEQAFAVAEKASPFIQFSYSLFCPLSAAVRETLDIEARCVKRIWRNLPPAKVWHFTQKVVLPESDNVPLTSTFPAFQTTDMEARGGQ